MDLNGGSEFSLKFQKQDSNGNNIYGIYTNDVQVRKLTATKKTGNTMMKTSGATSGDPVFNDA
jgi:hypothetical protein